MKIYDGNGEEQWNRRQKSYAPLLTLLLIYIYELHEINQFYQIDSEKWE